MADSPFTLVVVETASIQSYIFNSNRLKENVGGSYLVAMATEAWANESVQRVTDHVNLYLQIESDETVPAEVLYSGGGNFVVLFREPETARAFVRELSRKVQLDASGLRLTFAVREFAWEDALSAAVSDLLQDMKTQRSHQPHLRGTAGLGITIMGASTSMPAVTMEKDPDGTWQPYSAETVAKRNAVDAANKQLRATFNITSTDYIFPTELDELGRNKDDTSYIAVVHADGNGLGLIIQGLKERFPAGSNREYIAYMRDFAKNVKQVATLAQQDIAKQLLGSIHADDESRVRYIDGVGANVTGIELSRDERGRYIFPIRPLVSGGDDVTFVCDGRIGLDLAVTFLEAFEKHTTTVLGEQLTSLGLEKLTACAGIAVVKTHYPFARAYELADELAGSAKQARHDLGLPDVNNAPGAIDWHVTAGGIYGDLGDMRRREYYIRDVGRLTLRPVFLSDDHDLHSWVNMRRTITGFQSGWQDHQSKAEGLRAALRRGPAETEIYKRRYLSTSNDPKLPRIDAFQQNGWFKGRCGYYDALELMDKYIPLVTLTEAATDAT